MYVKSIKLHNYRNYEELCLEFGKKATVLIGKNGMGKTNLINALKQSMSFIFTKSSQIRQANFVANTMQKIWSFDTNDALRKFDPKTGLTGEGEYPVEIEAKVDIEELEPLKVIFRREDLSSGMKELYSREAIRYWEKYNSLEDLPILAFYSDSFPHEKVKMGKKIQDLLNSEFGIAQSAGYYNWDDPRDCGLVWQQYFIMQFKNYMYGHRNNNEEEYLRSVRECMISFSKQLDNAAENPDFELDDVTITARGKKELVVLQFKNKQKMDFESLPAGYRRAFSIAFDLANRAFLLNKNCNPNGVAFIDEVDLHLHPSLAQEIMERLQRTFPRIQFIVSTHSPLVLSNFKQDKDNVVYQLSRNDDFTAKIQKIDYSYGIDYNSLLVDLMGTKVRNTMLRQLIESYNYWKDAEEEELMNSTLEEIKGMVGENSRIVNELLA